MVAVYNIQRKLEERHYDNKFHLESTGEVLGHVEWLREEHWGIFALDEWPVGYYVWRHMTVFDLKDKPVAVLRGHDYEEVWKIYNDDPTDQYLCGYLDGDEDDLLNAAALWAFFPFLSQIAGHD